MSLGDVVSSCGALFAFLQVLSCGDCLLIYGFLQAPWRLAAVCAARGTDAVAN